MRMKGLEKVLDIIEAKIGKRKDFVVQDVLNYFNDDGIVEIPTYEELEHYGITGEWTEKKGYLEDNYYPGSIPFNGYELKGHCLLIKQEYLRKKYGAEYEKYCEENEKLRHIYGFIDVQAITVSTADGEHITWFDTTATYPPFAEAIILKAMWIYKRINGEIDPMEEDEDYYFEGELSQWHDYYENDAITLFCNGKE